MGATSLPRGDDDSGDGAGRRCRYGTFGARGPPLDYMLGKDAASGPRVADRSVDNGQRPLHASSASDGGTASAHEIDKGGAAAAAAALAGRVRGRHARGAPRGRARRPLRWQCLGDGGHPILLFRRVADATERTGGDGGHAAEEMRVVFNGQRHCNVRSKRRHAHDARVGGRAAPLMAATRAARRNAPGGFSRGRGATAGAPRPVHASAA